MTDSSPRRAKRIELVAGFVAAAVVVSGCSFFNRDAPDASCASLENGAKNDCGQGIVVSCVEGTIAYEVCTDEVDGVAPEDLCDAPWQIADAYRCTPVAIMVVAGVELKNDSNSDSALSPGEDASVVIDASNIGGASVTDLRVSFTLDPLVTVTDTGSPGASLGNMPPGATAPAYVNVHLADDAPLGPIVFGVRFVDFGTEDEWDDTFTVEVVEAP